MKFLVTWELGRLAKWLRILGLDAEYSFEKNHGALIIKTLQEERIIITRNRRFPAARGLRVVVLREERINDQLREFFQQLGIVPLAEEMFSRCTICNETLGGIAKDKIKEKIPEYVFQSQEKFLTCPRCRRIYWQGTHWNNAEEVLKMLKG